MTIRLTPAVTLYERRDWGARPWRRFTPQTNPSEGFIHHSTDRLAEYADTLAEQKAIARAIQRYHMDNEGWDDIGYNFLIFQPYGHRTGALGGSATKYARIFQGRPITHVPAAQAHHNTDTIAICVVGNFDHDDSVKDNTRHAIEVLINQRLPTLRVLGGHRDVFATECPGDTLYTQIPKIAAATRLRVYR